MRFERTELLEVVGFTEEHIRLDVVRRDMAQQRVAQPLGRAVRRHEAAGLDHRLVAPATEEVGGNLGLASETSLAHLLTGEHRRADRTDRTHGEHRGGDRRHLLGPVRHHSLLSRDVARDGSE